MSTTEAVEVALDEEGGVGMAYEFTPEMDEISGFGGGYEEVCRVMLKAGLEFWDQQPESFDPRYKSMKGVFGLLLDNNEDAKKLDDAIIAVANGATGAMHQAIVGHIFFIRQNGWDAYVREMSERKEEA